MPQRVRRALPPPINIEDMLELSSDEYPERRVMSSIVHADTVNPPFSSEHTTHQMLGVSQFLRDTDQYQFLGETLFTLPSPSVTTAQGDAFTDDMLDDYEMFEYANSGTNIQYTDTDVDLERSLDLRELLERDRLGSDALLCYRSKKFEERKIITQQDVRNGMDMQGIRWKKGVPDARREYRLFRCSTYENYFNSEGVYKGPTSHCTALSEDRSVLDFVQMETEYKCSLVHFQLRNLLTAVDRHSVYYTDARAVKVYNPHDHSCKTVMNLSNRSVLYPFKISSLALTEEYCCTGGFFGEYAIKPLRNDEQYSVPTDVHVGLVTTDTSGITNHISPQKTRSGVSQLVVSSNDSCLRSMDVETLKLTHEMYVDHPLNCSATSTDKRLTLVVGDHCSSMLLDAENGEILRTIPGHTDYSFSCAWSNDGYTFATGSQDLTTRLYDARGHTDRPIAIFKASMGAVRSLKFSECGKLLAVAEPADFVHVHDLLNLTSVQSIDFFGEISGIDFAGQSFFVGNADRMIGGIAEYELHRGHSNLENILL